jgi:hypothetical protein
MSDTMTLRRSLTPCQSAGSSQKSEWRIAAQPGVCALQWREIRSGALAARKLLKRIDLAGR